MEPIAQRLEVGGPAQALLALRLPAHFYQFNRTCPLEVFSSRRYPKPASLAGGMGELHEEQGRRGGNGRYDRAGD